MPYDPFAPFANPFADPFAAGRASVTRATPNNLPTLDATEEEGILARLGRTALGGLGYLGGSLDKAFGGRALRNVAGGLLGNTEFNPRELLSIIPFSDLTGLTNEDQAVSGRQVAGFDPNDDSWGATLGGMGVEMLTDPGTYLNPFGKTALGRIAGKSKGTMPKAGYVNAAGEFVAGVDPRIRITNNPFATRFQGQLATEMRGVQQGTDEASKLAAAVGLPGGVAGPVSAQAVADVVDEPLRALATLSLPFGEQLGLPGTLNLGTGARSQAIANKLSNVGDWLTYSKAGRAISPLFDARLSEFGAPGSPKAAGTEAVQRQTREKAEKFYGQKAGIREQHLKERDVLTGAGVDISDPTQITQVNEAMRSFLEGYKLPDGTLPQAIQDMNVAQLQELMQRHEGAKAAGRVAPELADDYTGYFPRGGTKLTDEGWNDPALRPSLAPHNPNDIRRVEAMTNIPLGTVGGENPLLGGRQASTGKAPLGGLKQMFEDPMTKAVPGMPLSIDRRAKYVRRKYLNWDKPTELEYQDLFVKSQNTIGPPMTAQEIERLAELKPIADQSRELVGMSTSAAQKAYDAGLANALAAGKTELQYGREIRKQFKDIGYGPHQNAPLADIHNYRMADAKANAAAGVVMDTLMQNAVATGGEGMVKVKDALAASGYNNKNARKLLGKGTLNWYIPQEIAADLTQKATSAFEKPSVLAPILNAVDSITNLNKGWMTKFYPSTILRNLFGEGYVNAAAGTGHMIESAADTARLRAGKGLLNLGDASEFRNLNPDEALKRWDDLAFIHGGQVPHTRAAMDDIIGASALDTGMQGTLAPIGERGNLLEAAKEAGSQMATGASDMWSHLKGPGGWNPMNWNWGGENALNPVGMAGVGGRADTTNALGFLGEQAMQSADQYGKHGAAMGLMRQGMDADVAWEKALGLRMGARKLAPFENEVMRRLVPFYRWSSHNIPHMLGELASNPGGLVGQSIRGANEIRQNEGILPDWIGQGLAVPIGSRDESTGNQRYLSTLGLPFEDLQNVASTGPNAMQRTGQKLLSMLNPALKAPLEQAFGTQLYSGRDLSDLYSRSGMPAVEGWLGATPLSRPLNVASTAIDPRKGLLGAATNIFSPGRITDVDMNRASQIQGRRLLEEELRTNPLIREHTDLYVPADQRARMTPEELQLLQLYRTLLARARQQRPATPAQ